MVLVLVVVLVALGALMVWQAYSAYSHLRAVEERAPHVREQVLDGDQQGLRTVVKDIAHDSEQARQALAAAPEARGERPGQSDSFLLKVLLGVFAADSIGRFSIDEALIEGGYLIVDLSNEQFDDEPRHSGDTIMRGELRS